MENINNLIAKGFQKEIHKQLIHNIDNLCYFNLSTNIVFPISWQLKLIKNQLENESRDSNR